MYFSRPIGRIVSATFTYNSINYIYIINGTKSNVNNNKIDNKISADFLHDSNKSIIFATNKDTFVLLTIKKVIIVLWIN